MDDEIEVGLPPGDPASSPAATGPGGRPQFRGDQLLRTVLVRRKRRASDALEFRELELYADGVVVRYVTHGLTYFDPNAAFERMLDMLPSEARTSRDPLVLENLKMARADPEALAVWAVWIEDDLDTAYSFGGGHGNGVDTMKWSRIFVPAVPEQAARLTLRSDYDSVQIDLRAQS
jgi:hypothetical protein